MNARIVIGANYGDEGKGTVVATYAKQSSGVLNVLTNGGAQRGHSILTEDGSMTFHHFGAGTYHGADNYYSRFFILNPIQFVKEYESLVIKPKNIYRDKCCLWSVPYDAMANLITEQQKKRHGSCGMGIWFTIKRYRETPTLYLDDFLKSPTPLDYLDHVKHYYERFIDIPDNWKDIWQSPNIKLHFLNDCHFMAAHTQVCNLKDVHYDNLIFENGQGLLLSDTGRDTYDTTPSQTGIRYSLELLKEIAGITDVTAHYVTRPYLTRHGDGYLSGETTRQNLSSSLEEDRTNHYNEGQGEFRYGVLNIADLHDRVTADAGNINFELEVTHCDEMDRLSEFQKSFGTIHTYHSPLV